MNPTPVFEQHLNWLLSHSIQAGLLVLLVLGVQWLFRRSLTSRWRFALWWIVLARLLLPFSPESSVSLFNVFRPTVRIAEPRQAAPAPASQNNASHAASSDMPDHIFPAVENIPLPQPTAPVANRQAPVQPAPAIVIPKHSWSFYDVAIPSLVGLWLAGALVLGGMVAVQLIRFQRKLIRAAAPSDPGLQTLLNDCRREFGVSRRMELLETDAIKSPALCGLWRLRLLLPRGFGDRFAGRELRYIFLHEIAHVKRGDLWLNWLVTVLQVLHWFNPLLWLGFARMRSDRELACDELALLRAGDQAGTAYGETVVKLLENLSRPTAIPGLVGILEDKKQMRRRISMIVNFRRPGRWSALAVILIAAIAAAALTDAQTSPPAAPDTVGTLKNPPAAAARPDLTGTISAKNGALSVPATVFIATAAPKTGTSTFCPSCYADCIKHVQTDARGNFRIESLDPQLTFQIFAVAKGSKPKSISKVDPTNGPVKIELEPVESADATPDRSLRGRVVNPNSQPIEGAVVSVQGLQTKDGGGRWGMLPGVDPLAVTDANGEFLVTAKAPFDMLAVKVTARTFADKNFDQLASGATRHELVMTEGASLTGRVLLNGQPLAGVSVGVTAVDRSAGSFLGHFEVGTGQHGDFTFLNLPPDADFYLYGIMETLAKSGSLPPQKIHTAKDGKTSDAGDLQVEPAHRLAGRVVLSDGQPLPPQVRLLVSRQEAWDSMQLVLDPDGRFDTAAVPSELISLSARVKGYHVSARNLSMDQMNPFQIIGRVDLDITNLVFILEKGPDPQPDFSHVDPDYDELRNRPLRGAESAPDHSLEWAVSGRVLDSETKEPVQNFRLTPGQADNFNRTSWSTLRAVEGSNGAYFVYINQHTIQPMLKVDADGYLPAGVELQTGDATNVDFILKKGSGPAGTIVAPDGKPEAGVSVVLLNDEFNQASFYSTGELKTFGSQSNFRMTGMDGSFAFKPVFGSKVLAAAASNGFAIVNLESLATNPVITLEPYGRITGTLKRTSGPGTNDTLNFSFADSTMPGLRGINLQTRVATDSKGHFEFDHVPAGNLRINLLVPMGTGHGSWRNDLMQEVDVEPGQTLEVNITAPERMAATENSYQPPPLVPVPGVRIKGFVLLPNGNPATNAEVALQLTSGPFSFSLGRGAFVASGLRENGLLVNAGADGGFDLPLFEGALAVVAVNETGFAQVSVDELKASPQIHLEQFGRIEGTLRVGHHLGTNETVDVAAAMPRWRKKAIRQLGQTNDVIEFANATPVIIQPLMYESGAFQARTDKQGHFVIPFVPPGDRTLWRKIPTDRNSWSQSQLATVEVKPGETIVTNIGGTGRTVVGHLEFNGDTPADFNNAIKIITTPTFKFFEKAQQLKTDAERQAYYQSPEVEAAMSGHQTFSVRVAPDGSFRAEDVLPGTYEFEFQPHALPDQTKGVFTMFASVQEFTVPEGKNQDDDSAVEWGTVAMKKRSFPIPAKN